MLDQVNLKENPTLAELGTGDFTGFGLVQQRDVVNLEKVGSLLQGERAHGYFQEQAQPAMNC